MSMIFKVFRKLKFYLDKAAYMQGVPQSGGPSISCLYLLIYDFNDIMYVFSYKKIKLILISNFFLLF